MNRLIARSLERHLPLNVHMDLTYRCNERCVHCYLDHEDYGEMTTAEVKRVLEELAREGALFITFSGGEIFLRVDFFELLAFARALRFDISLKTNGLLITRERAVQLKAMGVHKISISIYSDNPAEHDAVTKVPGSLEKSLETARMLKGLGLRVKLVCPIMRQNLQSYRGVQRLAEELGVPYNLDPTITPMMDGDTGLLQHRVSAQELQVVYADPKFNPAIAAHTEGPCSEALESVQEEASPYDSIPCSAGQNSAYISPYGDVYPCVQMPLPTGNVRRQSFRDVWYGSGEMQRVRAIRENMIEVCNQCEIRQHCERCGGLALMEDGDLTGPSTRACELAEMKARLAGVPQPVSALRKLREENGQGLATAHLPKQKLVTIAPVAAN
jgi:radical SAM protein with 4Fe4S-binding SPASM domain